MRAFLGDLRRGLWDMVRRHNQRGDFPDDDQWLAFMARQIPIIRKKDRRRAAIWRAVSFFIGAILGAGLGLSLGSYLFLGDGWGLSYYRGELCGRELFAREFCSEDIRAEIFSEFCEGRRPLDRFNIMLNGKDQAAALNCKINIEPQDFYNAGVVAPELRP